MLRSDVARRRPVFLKELGGFLEQLREDREWTLRGAASMAARRKLTPVTYQVLFRLEKGQTKNPKPEVLKAVADLYGIPYETLVGHFSEQRYGIGNAPLLHATNSDAMPPPGGLVDDRSPSARRLAELERRLAEYESAFASLREVTKRLVEIAAIGKEGRAPRAHTAKRGHRT